MCDICTEPFNQTIHYEIVCPSCDLKACRSCVKRYLLGTNEDPHCMQCHKHWDRRFLVTNLTKSFVNGEYKLHRQNILLQRQRALLPSAVRFIEMEDEVDREKKIYTHVEKKCTVEINREMRLLYNKGIQMKEEYQRMRREMERPHMKKIRKNRDIISNARDKYIHIKNFPKREKSKFINSLYLEISGETEEEEEEEEDNEENEKEERDKFSSRGSCPRGDCNGLIMKGWICTSCKCKKCKKCHEEETEDHVCNENTIASIALMKSDAKPCPRCRVMIHRISGCPQMFCTECHTFFDYNSGKKLDPRNAHNPEHTRLVNEGKIEGGRNSMYRRLERKSSRIVRWVLEFNDYAHFNFSDNIKRWVGKTFDLRTDFLRGNLDEPQWKKKAQEIEKRIFFHRECYELTLTFVNTVTMMTNQPCFYENENLKESSNTVQDLATNFQELKDELCEWYNYKKRPLCAISGGEATYN